MTLSKQQHSSPFHQGEHLLQTRAGKRDTMENFGRRAIRTFMPNQHREFFAQLPFIVVGSVDQQDWPWASIVSGNPGFIHSPDASVLDIQAPALSGDPLKQNLQQVGTPLGLLGIDMMSRRRNRMNGRIMTTAENQFSVKVDQSFGNCPQYIQNRSLTFTREPTISNNIRQVSSFTDLDDNAQALISTADTFFVTSFVPAKDQPALEGVDVSHRGGQMGFVKVEGNTLTIPDFPGNYYFNTLGNFLVNPKAGLLFINFTTGELLMLTGTVELLWEPQDEIVAFKGAERAWRFTLDHGIRLQEALPFTAHFESFSPNTLLTGSWQQANNNLAAKAKPDTWQPYRVSRIEDESTLIRSFYLQPTDGKGITEFSAGQFLTIKILVDTDTLIRTYTLSSTPEDNFYRISVKREVNGKASNHLHDHIAVNDIIEAKIPRGEFFIDPTETRPAVLIAGGVGITPMISMATHIKNQALLTRHLRPLTIFHAAKNSQQRAFFDDFLHLEQETGSGIRYYSFLSEPTDKEKPGIDYQGSGHINVTVFCEVLALDDYDFYLCGPASFMHAMYDQLLSLGVNDQRIFAEAFGPAAIKRKIPTEAITKNTTTLEEAEQAIIRFTQSNVEQRWNKNDPTLLEVAEAHGLTPEFSCRNGVCGSCVSKIKSGKVSYRTNPTASCEDDEVFICCAVPASDTVEIDL